MAHFCSHCGKPVEQNANFCRHCGKSIADRQQVADNWQRKRQKVLGAGETRKKNWLKPAFIVALFVGAAGWVYLNLPDKGSPVIKAQPVVFEAAAYPESGQQMFDMPVNIENGKIIVPLNIVKEKKFVAFNYTTPTNVVPLLAYVSGQGKIVTAVSMCEPCNSKRFHIQGNKLVCNSCGTTWELDNLEAVSGSCGKYPPDAIANVVVGNEIQIDVQAVAAWQRRI